MDEEAWTTNHETRAEAEEPLDVVLDSAAVRRLIDEEAWTTTHGTRAEAEDPLDAVLDSAAVRRLIEEVRAEEVEVPRSYNRTFNRHNR